MRSPFVAFGLILTFVVSACGGEPNVNADESDLTEPIGDREKKDAAARAKAVGEEIRALYEAADPDMEFDYASPDVLPASSEAANALACLTEQTSDPEMETSLLHWTPNPELKAPEHFEVGSGLWVAEIEYENYGNSAVSWYRYTAVAFFSEQGELLVNARFRHDDKSWLWSHTYTGWKDESWKVGTVPWGLLKVGCE